MTFQEQIEGKEDLAIVMVNRLQWLDLLESTPEPPGRFERQKLADLRMGATRAGSAFVGIYVRDVKAILAMAPFVAAQPSPVVAVGPNGDGEIVIQPEA